METISNMVSLPGLTIIGKVTLPMKKIAGLRGLRQIIYLPLLFHYQVYDLMMDWNILFPELSI
jgi:hypothetical protein